MDSQFRRQFFATALLIVTGVLEAHMHLAFAQNPPSLNSNSSSPTVPRFAGILKEAFPSGVSKLYAILVENDHTIIAAGNNKTIGIWDPSTGKAIATLQQSNPVTALAISGDSKKLLAGDSGGSVVLWDLSTHQKILTLSDLKGTVSQVAIAADGKTIAGGNLKSARVWDVGSGKETMTFQGRFALSPSGKILAFAKPDGSIQLWDIGTNKPTIALAGHTGRVQSLAFSPDEKVLATGGADPRGIGASGTEPGQDNLIKLWDVGTGKLQATLSGHRKGIYSITFAADSHSLVAADFTGVINYWNTQNDKLVATLDQILEGEVMHGTPIGFWAISPDLKSWAATNEMKIELIDISGFTRGVP
jgi:WD40 repeat protein